MPSREAKIYETVTAETGPTYPNYDVRQGARTYAAIGGTLSGFSFAAVVLLARSGIDCTLLDQSTFCTPEATALRDRAATAFLIAFFGCVSGTFVFAITGAEELLSKRAHSMAFFGSSGFALGIGYAFWGLALLSYLFLRTESGDAVVVANLMVIAVASTAPAFLAAPALHIKSAFGSSSRDDAGDDPDPASKGVHDLAGRALSVSTAARDWVVAHRGSEGAEREPRGSLADWGWALGPGYLVVACGVALLLTFGSQLEAAPHEVFTLMFVFVLVLAVLGVLGTLFVGAQSLRFSVTPRWAGVYAAVHTGLLWMLVLLLPPF